MGRRIIFTLNLTFLLILLFALVLFSIKARANYSVAHCKLSYDSCSFYNCAEQEFQCGNRGYFQKIAAPLCQPNLYSTRADTSVRHFTRLVRMCLQKQVLRMAPFANSCDSIKDLALDSHVSCFASAGFCELNASQRIHIFKNPFQFLKISSPQKMLSISNQIFAICRAKKDLPVTRPTSEVGI